MPRLWCACALACAAAATAQAPLEPVTVCEILHDLPAHEGRDFAVFGRYSYRTTGRWVSEQSCAPPVDVLPELWLVEDVKDAPHPPDDFEIDALKLRRKYADMAKRTSLGKFRFGTPDYDRWAVIYGRVETRKGDDARKAPANLMIRGTGVIVFFAPPEP